MGWQEIQSDATDFHAFVRHRITMKLCIFNKKEYADWNKINEDFFLNIKITINLTKAAVTRWNF